MSPPSASQISPTRTPSISTATKMVTGSSRGRKRDGNVSDVIGAFLGGAARLGGSGALDGRCGFFRGLRIGHDGPQRRFSSARSSSRSALERASCGGGAGGFAAGAGFSAGWSDVIRRRGRRSAPQRRRIGRTLRHAGHGRAEAGIGRGRLLPRIGLDGGRRRSGGRPHGMGADGAFQPARQTVGGLDHELQFVPERLGAVDRLLKRLRPTWRRFPSCRRR